MKTTDRRPKVLTDPLSSETITTATKLFVLPERLGASFSSVLAQATRYFESEVNLESHGRRANAKETLELLSLHLQEGATVIVSATGVDVHEVMESLDALFVFSPFDRNPGHTPFSPSGHVRPTGTCG